ncbi:hypothetical protein SK128_023063 [Halocaridina rubra]|uniref:Uncharacterized protein n=1 Tax=Halocaridina rubra TaxID=373956 RepID=A0AAN9A1G1_HALRR
MQLLVKTFNELEETVHFTLETLSNDIRQDLLQNEASDICAEDDLDWKVRGLTAKVEQLINARATLVDAANELVEELEEAVTHRMAPLKQEFEKLLKQKSLEEKDVQKEEKQGPDHDLSSSSAVKLETDLCRAFVEEFVEITSNICEEAQGQKLQILQSQKELIQKIFEDNEEKLTSLCQQKLQDLHRANSLSDAINVTMELVSTLEQKLSEEVSWVDQQYQELLRQYSHEQNLINTTNSHKMKDLEEGLTDLLKNSPVEAELAKLKAVHAAEVKKLQNQIALQDNDMLLAIDDVDLQLRSDLSRLRRTENSSLVLCPQLEDVTVQVTQLLHYFSVAESYTHKPQSPHPAQEVEDHLVTAQPESLIGRVLDLSFLSEDKSEYCDNQLSVFPEDNAVSVGLIGRNAQGDHCDELDIVSNSGSILDSTVMSEGLLEDVEKDEQVRSFLTKSYPQLMSILKGRWDHVVVENLEREVQELTISLQASAGMLKIFMHSVCREPQNLQSLSVQVPAKRDASPDSSFVTLEPENITNATEDSQVHAEDTGDVSKQVSQAKPIGAEPAQSVLLESNLLMEISSILSQDESFLNLTNLRIHDLDNREKLKLALKEFCQMAENAGALQVEIHHLNGLISGLNEEISTLQDENNRLEHYSRNLAAELQATKDQLTEVEMESEEKKKSSTSSYIYAAKMEATKDIKERVRSALSAKNKSAMDHEELVSRNGHLERLLETVVQDYDKKIEALKLEIQDLSQQLEVADRQLRSSRQFLDEQASEREKEVEDLLREKDKLANQLREKDIILSQQSHTVKEVENLERELREVTHECKDTLKRKKELEVEQKASFDKIQDLRVIISNLEVELDAKRIHEGEQQDCIDELTLLLEQLRQQHKDLSAKIGYGDEPNGEQKAADVGDSASHITENDVVNSQHQCQGKGREDPLSVELNEMNEDEQLFSRHKLVIEEYVNRITLLLLGISVCQSSEDLAARHQLDRSSPYPSENSQAVSPGALGQTLEEKLASLECTTEAAVKRVHDMRLTEKNLRQTVEEVMGERNLLQNRLDKHLLEVATLEARLDEVRRADHPEAAYMRQKLTSLQEELENSRIALIKQGQKNEELKLVLQDTKTLLSSRELELDRLKCVSGNLDKLEEDITRLLADSKAKDELIESLQRDNKQCHDEARKFPLALAHSLIDEKNAEIDDYIRKLGDLNSEIKRIVEQIHKHGMTEEIMKELYRIIGVERASVNTLDESEVMRKDGSTPESLEATSVMSIFSIHRGKSSPTTVNESLETDSQTEAGTLLSIQSDKGPDLEKISSSPIYVSQASQTEDGSLEKGSSSVEHSIADNTETSDEKTEERKENLTNEDYECLTSASEEFSLLKMEIELLKSEIQNMNNYQGKEFYTYIPSL